MNAGILLDRFQIIYGCLTCSVPWHELELVDQLDGWNQEREGFSGTGFGGAHQVLALQEVGQGAGLDVGHVGEPHVGDPLHGGLAQRFGHRGEALVGQDAHHTGARARNCNNQTPCQTLLSS